MLKKNIRSLTWLFLALIIFPLLAVAGRSGQPDSQAKASGQAESFFPVSVWYTGGKVRAPMIENVTPASAAIWKKDLEQIKKLGFNTVRAWIEWSYNEKQEGQYDFSALKLLTDLAGQVKEGRRLLVAVAGGIRVDTEAAALAAGADILVVGRAITRSKDIRDMAEQFLAGLKQTEIDQYRVMTDF